jgi:hypothetical protein
MATFEERFKLATKQLKASGVAVYRNVQGCCRGCIGSDKFDNPTVPIIWHYGGQGNRFKMEGDVVYTADGGYESGIYFNHSNLTDSLKEIVVNIFTINGIVIDWDKSDSRCILVKPRESVEHRTLEEQAYLVNDMLNKYGLTYSEMFNYRNKYLFESLWSVAVSADGVVESWFRSERESIDAQAKRVAEQVERERLQLVQEGLREQLLAVVKHDDVDRFALWLRVANITLEQSDVDNAGVLLVALEGERFVGAYSDLDDLALEHYGEDLKAIPKYFRDKIRVSDLRYDLMREVYTHGRKASVWNEPSYVWKRK